MIGCRSRWETGTDRNRWFVQVGMELHHLMQSHISHPEISVTIECQPMWHIKLVGSSAILDSSRLGAQSQNRIHGYGTLVGVLVVVGFVESAVEKNILCSIFIIHIIQKLTIRPKHFHRDEILQDCPPYQWPPHWFGPPSTRPLANRQPTLASADYPNESCLQSRKPNNTIKCTYIPTIPYGAIYIFQTGGSGLIRLIYIVLQRITDAPIECATDIVVHEIGTTSLMHMVALSMDD